MMKRMAQAVIRFYQRVISPLFGPRCKYYPTCSAYAYSAFERFGFFRGVVLSAWRIVRCNPFSRGGLDYLPERFSDAFTGKKKGQSSQPGKDTYNKPDGGDC